jgi:hypothetical protein
MTIFYPQNRATKILGHHRFAHSQGAPHVHVEGTVITVFGGPGNHHGANHQHFTVKIDKVLALDGAQFDEPAIEGQTVFVAVRFGDTEGLDSEIPDLREQTPIEIQGEYIAEADAYETEDNEGPDKRPVLHFTHHPVGFIRYNGQYYS